MKNVYVMHVAINDKGGDCWKFGSLSSLMLAGNMRMRCTYIGWFSWSNVVIDVNIVGSIFFGVTCTILTIPESYFIKGLVKYSMLIVLWSSTSIFWSTHHHKKICNFAPLIILLWLIHTTIFKISRSFVMCTGNYQWQSSTLYTTVISLFSIPTWEILHFLEKVVLMLWFKR